MPILQTREMWVWREGTIMDNWLEFLNTVGATFWRGFPYDIFFLWVLLWGHSRVRNQDLRKWIGRVAVFMAILITVNLIIGTVPAWIEGTTW